MKQTFASEKLHNKNSLALYLPREYQTDINLNNQEFRAEKSTPFRLPHSVKLAAETTCRSCREVFNYKYHLVSIKRDFYNKKADYACAEKSTMGLTSYREKERTQSR